MYVAKPSVHCSCDHSKHIWHCIHTSLALLAKKDPPQTRHWHDESDVKLCVSVSIRNVGSAFPLPTIFDFPLTATLAFRCGFADFAFSLSTSSDRYGDDVRTAADSDFLVIV